MANDQFDSNLKFRLQSLIENHGGSKTNRELNEDRHMKIEKTSKGTKLNQSSSIIEREKSYRVNSRAITLEKMGDSVPLFIQEMSSYQKFKKEATFVNLSSLLNEIFTKGASIANQAYSPTMIDHLSIFYII